MDLDLKDITMTKLRLTFFKYFEAPRFVYTGFK
jgi:hypothetical protein